MTVQTELLTSSPQAVKLGWLEKWGFNQ